jgi:hypothetical protein
MKEETQITPAAALFDWDRKNAGGGGGGRAKMQLEAKSFGIKLRTGGLKFQRRFHAGHHLSSFKINNIVKVRYVKNDHDSTRHIIQHIDYLLHRERDRDEPERKFYGRDGERSRDDVIDTVMKNHGDEAAMFKIILSPKQNELNHILYTAEIMRRFEEQTGIKTDWSLVEHKNTQHHHVHIVMPGRDMDGNSFRLEDEHLDLLRELANEYQYELQDIEYQWEKQVEQEFGYSREEAELMLIAQKDRQDMKDLGVYQPGVDKVVTEEILRPTNLDQIQFVQQLQKQFWNETSKDFQDLQSEMSAHMQQHYPQLYCGLVTRMQGLQIDNAYFSRLQQLDANLYREYADDPSIDRTYLIGRLKQAFPEWFDPIVVELKELQPKLFADYEKPAPTDRQIMDNLRDSDPELFPELSKQIQEKQLNTILQAMLAFRDPDSLERILNERDPQRQKELLNEAKGDHYDFIESHRQRLADKHPELYQWGQKNGPSQAEILTELVKDRPDLFPHATKELQKQIVDQALFERFREANPDFASQFESNSRMQSAIGNLVRFLGPEALEKTTDAVKEKLPKLFQYDRQEPSELEMIKALEKSNPTLFPKVMQALKQQQIDRAYFQRALETTQPELKQYVENLELDRTKVHQQLRKAHPEWLAEFTNDLKDRRPELFKYDRQGPTQDEIIEGLVDDREFLFPVIMQRLKQEEINLAYFRRAKEETPDAVKDYQKNPKLDRTPLYKQLKKDHPDWRDEIETELKEERPGLFRYDREHPSDSEVIAELLKSSPELFPGVRRLVENQLAIETSPRLQKLEQMQQRLVDRGYFDKGRQDMSDGLIEYLESIESDRQYVIDGLKLAHPEWRTEIEARLRDLHPQLFTAIDQEHERAIEEVRERLNEMQELAAEHTKEKLGNEAVLLIGLNRSEQERSQKDLEKPAGEQERTGADEKSSEPEAEHDHDAKEDSDEKTDQLLETAQKAILEVENLKSGKEWSGLMGPNDPAFVAEPLNLSAEAQALFDSTQNISKQANEFEENVVELDPNLFKLEDMLEDLKEDLDNIEKDDNDRSV